MPGAARGQRMWSGRLLVRELISTFPWRQCSPSVWNKLGNIHVGQQAMVAGIKEGNAAIKEGNAALTEAIKAGFAELAQSLSGKKDPPGGSSVPAMPPVGPSHGMPGYASTGYTTTPMTPPVPPAPTVPAPAMPSACEETSAWPGTCANFKPHKPGPTQTPCAPPVRELWVACSATQELPTRPSYAPKALEQKRKSVGTKKAVLEVLGQKKFTLDTQVTHWHTASKRCQPAWLQTYRDWRIDRWIGGR